MGAPKIRGTLVLAMWIFRVRLFCDLLSREAIHMFMILHQKMFAARYVRHVKSCICRCSWYFTYDILIECSCHVCSATKDFQDSAGSRMLYKTGLRRGKKKMNASCRAAFVHTCLCVVTRLICTYRYTMINMHRYFMKQCPGVQFSMTPEAILMKKATNHSSATYPCKNTGSDKLKT